LTLRAIYLTLHTHGVGFFGRHAVQGAWVRSGVLVGAAELIGELGGDVHVVCLAAQLDPAALVARDLPVPAAAVTSFLEAAAEHCACDSFGLRLAALQDLTVLGPLWVLMRSGATVGVLLDNLTRYFVIFTTGALVGAERVEQGLFVTYSTASGISTGDRQIIELGLALLCAEMRLHAPPGWQPAAVQLRHKAPADATLHRRAFGSALAFNQDRNAVLIDNDLLAGPTLSGDARSGRVARAILEQRALQRPSQTALRVEGVVRALLPFSDCTIDAVALALHMSQRTMQRQLAEAGANFQQVRDRVRADLALKYVRQSALQFAEISEILGFSEPSAFTRSFRRWHACSPRDARKAPVPASG
jgi:AraC-like DNA-binding protein